MKKHFLTLEDGTPVSLVKNQAKKSHKSKRFPSLSSAQNAITKSLVNKSFGKAVEKAKEISPFILPVCKSEMFQNDVDALFIPIYVEANENATKDAWGHPKVIPGNGFYYYVSITATHIYLDASTSIKLDREININEIKLKNIVKIHGHTKSGWRVSLEDFAIEIRHSDELGITADVWSVIESELSETIHNASIETCGLVTDNFDYSKVASSGVCTDYEMSLILECNDPDGRNYIFSAGGLDLVLSSCITTRDLEGNAYHGYSTIYSGLSESYETEEELNKLKTEFNAWTHGKYSPLFDYWEIDGNPWLSVDYDNGEHATEVLCEVPTDFQDRLLMVLSSLAKA